MDFGSMKIRCQGGGGFLDRGCRVLVGGGCYQDWVQSTSGCSLDRVQQSTKSGCRKGPDNHLQQDYPQSCKQNHPEIKQTRLLFLLQNKQFASLFVADKTENNEIYLVKFYL